MQNSNFWPNTSQHGRGVEIASFKPRRVSQALGFPLRPPTTCLVLAFYSPIRALFHVSPPHRTSLILLHRL
ncbi:hypothetical protein P171DRAFT_116056 [Karstenula rhodostoma CBS 690.94]|uniref:Uncharacterized protein n=1 Tax=Karstenula rhodostoma CBS 690.94 TaxID=1392251 RepID=A0A9P4PBC9_9PLEO|nr:hypothetical protein P171DRAFT_116056 [Karstenula rhodostoma CBS 690.94]